MWDKTDQAAHDRTRPRRSATLHCIVQNDGSHCSRKRRPVSGMSGRSMPHDLSHEYLG